MRIYADYHTHTKYSHGKGTIRENVEAAVEKGLEEVAISDHGPNSAFWGIKSLQTLDQIIEEIAKVQADFPQIKILAGVEANIISTRGDLDVPLKDLRKLDIKMAGVHLQIIPASLRDGYSITAKNLLAQFTKRTSPRTRTENTKTVIEAIYRNPLDVITHPGFRVNIDTVELAKACAKMGTAMEINTSHDTVTVEYLKIGKREGAKFMMGSDAHTPDRVGDFAKGIALAKKAGLTENDIINACSIKGN
jgi:putative hydrolase